MYYGALSTTSDLHHSYTVKTIPDYQIFELKIIVSSCQNTVSISRRRQCFGMVSVRESVVLITSFTNDFRGSGSVAVSQQAVYANTLDKSPS